MNCYTVDEKALEENISAILNEAGATKIWAVLKGDGYGLGLIPMAEIMKRKGIDRFCVSEPAEAEALRRAGFVTEKILMLTPVADKNTVKKLLRLRVVFTVSSITDARALETAARETNTSAEAHLKIDTGMGRYGFRPETNDDMLIACIYMRHVKVSGIYTHFASAASRSKTLRQYRLFCGARDKLEDSGFKIGEAHCCNSAAFLKYPQMRGGAARIGSAFLGRVNVPSDIHLNRIGICEAVVTEIKKTPRGASTGYSGAWKAKRDSKLAIVSVGWFHGFGEQHGNCSYGFKATAGKILSALKCFFMKKTLFAQINGEMCPIRGYIGMLHAAADVTEISCAEGDAVKIDIGPLVQRNMRIKYINSEQRSGKRIS